MSVDPNIFSGINFDEGDEDPWGIQPGQNIPVVISNVEMERSKNDNLGLWVTFSDAKGKTIRRWITMPEQNQDDDVRKRNTTFLKLFLKNIELPESKWKDLNPEDFIGIECLITVRPQKDNDEYMQVTKVRRAAPGAMSGEGISEFKAPTDQSAPADGGYKF